MILLVGLGNIGEQYENTRHNVGFILADLLLDSEFTNISSSKFKGKLYKKGSLLILKPSTFMNLSGLSLKAVCDFYKPENIIVAHDDLDLQLGDLKFKRGGGNAGHNGLKSIDTLIGTDYIRVRIGIGNDKKNVVSHVLGKFSDNELTLLKSVLENAKNGILDLINGAELNLVSSKYSLKAPKIQACDEKLHANSQTSKANLSVNSDQIRVNSLKENL